MSDKFQAYNVSQFFNNTVEEVATQVKFCGYMHYGKQFKSDTQDLYSKVHFTNVFLSVWDTLMIGVVDCYNWPHDSDYYFDLCRKYLEANKMPMMMMVYKK